MSVNSVCNHNVATITRDTDVLAAAVRLREEHVGTLIVVESRGGASAPIGIVTDRDIVVGIVARQVSPESVAVGELMSSNLVTVKQDNGIASRNSWKPWNVRKSARQPRGDCEWLSPAAAPRPGAQKTHGRKARAAPSGRLEEQATRS